VSRLGEPARRELLEIARRSLAAAVRGEPPPRAESRDPELQRTGGCFVTYKNAGRLRGCIGCFESGSPIWATVAEYAAISATGDPRFRGDPITPGELPEIEVEISVLSPLERIADPLKIELGVHGIYVRRGSRSGCFLPQVATEHGMSREQFLSECCAGKAGLAPDAWRQPGTEVLVFTAEIVADR